LEPIPAEPGPAEILADWVSGRPSAPQGTVGLAGTAEFDATCDGGRSLALRLLWNNLPDVAADPDPVRRGRVLAAIETVLGPSPPFIRTYPGMSAAQGLAALLVDFPDSSTGVAPPDGAAVADTVTEAMASLAKDVTRRLPNISWPQAPLPIDVYFDPKKYYSVHPESTGWSDACYVPDDRRMDVCVGCLPEAAEAPDPGGIRHEGFHWIQSMTARGRIVRPLWLEEGTAQLFGSRPQGRCDLVEEQRVRDGFGRCPVIERTAESPEGAVTVAEVHAFEYICSYQRLCCVAERLAAGDEGLTVFDFIDHAYARGYGEQYLRDHLGIDEMMLDDFVASGCGASPSSCPMP
jgi:hypothetical protein